MSAERKSSANTAGQRVRRRADRLRVGAPSFVYPDSWLGNVERLAPDVDDIELLLFAGLGELPGDDEIEGLRRTKQSHGLSYQLHMPLGLSLASEVAEKRRAAVSEVLAVADRLAPVEPWLCVVHVYYGECEGDPEPPRDLAAWQKRAHESLLALVRGGLDPEQIGVEHLDYDLGLLAPVLDDLGLAVVLDVGHLARDGRDLKATVERFLPRTRAVQVHGTDPADRDHRSLEHLDPAAGQWLVKRLQEVNFAGVVTLEVFRPQDWASSLRLWQRWLRGRDEI